MLRSIVLDVAVHYQQFPNFILISTVSAASSFVEGAVNDQQFQHYSHTLFSTLPPNSSPQPTITSRLYTSHARSKAPLLDKKRLL